MTKNKMPSRDKMSLNGKKKANSNDGHKKVVRRNSQSRATAEEPEYNNLSLDDKYRLADLYFDKENVAYRVLYDSFNKFIDEDVKNFLEHGDHVFAESKDKKTSYKNRFKFSNIRIQEPRKTNGDLMFPQDARKGNYTYTIKIVADVVQYQDVEDITTKEIKTHKIGNPEENVPIANIPVMLRSRWCNLTLNKNATNNGEGKFDVGGYFIVKGNEKVVINQDRMIDNKPLVFVKKDSGNMVLGVNVNSRSYGPKGEVQIMFIKMKKDGILICRVPIFNEVNIIAIMKALGLETDKEIVDRIVYDENDIEMINLVRTSLDNCKNEKGVKIKTSQQAIDYLITKMKSTIQYDDIDREIKLQQKKKHLEELLKNVLLPHMDSSTLEKAYYIGYMINKLLNVQLGRATIDDRDSYVNKRVDTPGDLFFEIFKLQMKKVMGDCKKYFNDRSKQGNITNIIDHIKPGTIEQGLIASLSTGHWGRKQGVAQVLPRLSTPLTRSMLSRVDAPGGDASTSKLTGPRHLHFSSIGFLSPAMTPEHAKIGLVKHFSLISSISIMSREQYYDMKDYVMKKATPISNIPINKFKNGIFYKLFLNGQWVGGTDKFIEIEKEFTEMKLKGIFDRKNVSIVVDHQTFEVRLYCDTGRFIRPVLRVENNNILLTKEHINNISLNKSERATKITSWEEFINKYPYLIEYICMETQPYLMLAETSKKVEFMRKRMIESIEKVKNVKSNHTENRYGDLSFNRYTHCEIHPSLLEGEINASLQFCNHDPGTRNMFQYAQGKQAMGIPTDIYRRRYDLCFVAYNPERRIVSTRASKYTMSEQLPAGENAIVAIATYTGYNQEDSLIMNKTSLDRGKYRAMYLKKISMTVQKNMSTAQDDIFMKPNKDEVDGTRFGNYDSLNDQGYAPEETPVSYGTVVIGKVTPKSNPSGNKKYRDTSEIYKQHVPGYVDRVEIGIQNPDGYELRKMSIRTERYPNDGDKFCCYDDQTEVLTDNGWIFFKDLTKEHKVATLVENDTLVYQHPTELMEYDFDGEMYHIKSTQINLMVTPNHRMYIKSRDKNDFEIKEAKDIFGKTVQYKKNAEKYDRYKISTSENIEEYEDENDDKFIIPSINEKTEDIRVNLDAFIEFFGIWIAEGSTTVNNLIVFSDKPHVQKRCSELCTIMGLDLDKNNDNTSFQLCNQQIYEYFNQFNVGTVNKFLPDWTWQLNQRRCRILIYGMLLENCHQMKNTTSKQLANDFQRLCLHAGYSCNIDLTNVYRMTVITVDTEPTVNEYVKQDKMETYKGKVYCCSVPSIHPKKNKDNQDTQGGVIYVRRQNYVVWSGNSVHGQKGTIGIKLPCTDMPFTSSGLQPDIIMNPQAIPSRMTAGQLIECIHAKVGALEGMPADGTPFEETDLKPIEEKLEKHGFNKKGKEYLYNGMTGYMMPVMIFIGPTYYQRLKHLVEDKIHSRARGPVSMLTRQAPEGRARDGGLRMGEMERDALIAHGIALFAKEKLLDNSDAYKTYICGKCGLIAQRFVKDDETTNSYYCQQCNNHNDINKVIIPYAFKLLIQECMSMCIAPRLRFKKEF